MKKRSKRYLLTLALAGILTAGNTTMAAYAVSPASTGTVVTPGGPTGPETVTIENAVVPLASIPDSPVPLVDIPDSAVPLAGIPGMGDTSMSGLWLMLFAGSGLGIAALELGSRRRRSEKR